MLAGRLATYLASLLEEESCLAWERNDLIVACSMENSAPEPPVPVLEAVKSSIAYWATFSLSFCY